MTDTATISSQVTTLQIPRIRGSGKSPIIAMTAGQKMTVVNRTAAIKGRAT